MMILSSLGVTQAYARHDNGQTEFPMDCVFCIGSKSGRIDFGFLLMGPQNTSLSLFFVKNYMCSEFTFFFNLISSEVREKGSKPTPQRWLTTPHALSPRLRPSIVILVTSSKVNATLPSQQHYTSTITQPFNSAARSQESTSVSRTSHGTPPRNLHSFYHPLHSRLLETIHPLQHHSPPPAPHLLRTEALLRLRLPPSIPNLRRLLPSSRAPPRKILVQIHRLLPRTHRRTPQRA